MDKAVRSQIYQVQLELSRIYQTALGDDTSAVLNEFEKELVWLNTVAKLSLIFSEFSGRGQ